MKIQAAHPATFIANETIPAGARVKFTSGAGAYQVETATVAGTIGASGAGNVSVTVTGATIPGSPIVVNSAVANDDTASAVAALIRADLNELAAITNLFTVGGSGAAVTLTALSKLGNDTTLNIATATGTATGLTAAPTSVNTTAGSSPYGGGVRVGLAAEADTEIGTAILFCGKDSYVTDGPVGVQLVGFGGSLTCIASGTISAGEAVYRVASGKVANAAGGTTFGFATTDAADGDNLEVLWNPTSA